MFALDTNILVYAHNLDSSRYQKAKGFLESIMANVNGTEKTAIGIPSQVWTENPLA